MGIRNRYRRLVEEIGAAGTNEETGAADLPALPEATRRYLERALPPGMRRVRSVRLRIRGEMRPRPGARPFALEADEVLTPGAGFAWLAATRIGPFTMDVLDAYHDGEGFMAGRMFGVIPMMNASGEDVTRSSLGRLAAEAVFAPPALIPRPGLWWEAVDRRRARLHQSIGGEDLEVEFVVDDGGSLTEVTMLRHGDVGRDGWGPIPYGFRIEEEASFEGVTVPSMVRGGWWYGTDRYDPGRASVFEVLDARFS
jgi:hypothetical protein